MTCHVPRALPRARVRCLESHLYRTNVGTSFWYYISFMLYGAIDSRAHARGSKVRVHPLEHPHDLSWVHVPTLVPTSVRNHCAGFAGGSKVAPKRPSQPKHVDKPLGHR